MEWNLNHYPWYVSYFLGIITGLLYAVAVLILHGRTEEARAGTRNPTNRVTPIDSYSNVRRGA